MENALWPKKHKLLRNRCFLPPYIRNQFRNQYFVNNKKIRSNSLGIRIPPVFQAYNIFLLLSLVCSANGRWRVLWRKTIGTGTSVRLGFPNARPVVFDERSEEFRRSVSSSNKREKNKIFCFSEQEKNRWNQRKPYRTVPGEPAWRYKIRNRNRKKKN